MSLDNFAFSDEVTLLAAVVAGILLGVTIQQLGAKFYRRSLEREPEKFGNWTRRRKGEVVYLPNLDRLTSPKPTDSPNNDAADQLRVVMGANFAIQSLLNQREARLFRELDQLVVARNRGWRVMAQVSLGEVLRSPDSSAYRCINSKRVDLLLVDENCQPRHALEYQGSGHYQSQAAARDAVKKEALRRAGIGYHEIVAGETRPSDLVRLVEKLVDADEQKEPSPASVLA